MEHHVLHAMIPIAMFVKTPLLVHVALAKPDSMLTQEIAQNAPKPIVLIVALQELINATYVMQHFSCLVVLAQLVFQVVTHAVMLSLAMLAPVERRL